MSGAAARGLRALSLLVCAVCATCFAPHAALLPATGPVAARGFAHGAAVAPAGVWGATQGNGVGRQPLTTMRFGATAAVIETLSEQILRRVLTNPRASVTCKVQSTAMELVQGNLREARVGGENWSTPAGMTMRSIDLTLNGLSINLQDVLRGAITFKCPAKGRAVLTLTAEDFANFLIHPLLTTAPLPSGEFTFDRAYSTIDPAAGAVYFSGLWHGEHVILEATQPQPYGEIYVAVADAPRLTRVGAETLSAELTRFFNEVTLEMDGTFLTFTDMRTGARDAATGAPTVRVTVDISVHRVPNPRSLKF